MLNNIKEELIKILFKNDNVFIIYYKLIKCFLQNTLSFII